MQDGDAARRVLASRLTPRPSQPVVVVRFGIGRLPDVHRLEVRAVRVRIADALHDRELAGVPHGLKPLHAGVQADVIVEADDAVPSSGGAWAGPCGTGRRRRG